MRSENIQECIPPSDSNHSHLSPSLLKEAAWHRPRRLAVNGFETMSKPLCIILANAQRLPTNYFLRMCIRDCSYWKRPSTPCIAEQWWRSMKSFIRDRTFPSPSFCIAWIQVTFQSCSTFHSAFMISFFRRCRTLLEYVKWLQAFALENWFA